MSNKDIKPVNNKGQAHGYWERYWVMVNYFINVFIIKEKKLVMKNGILIMLVIN